MSAENKADYLARVSIVIKNISKPIRELYLGFRSNTIPVGYCILGIGFMQFLVYLEADFWIFERLNIAVIYPGRGHVSFVIYYLILILCPFWMWAIFRALIAERLTRRLTEVFRAIGLQNKLGSLPKLIVDVPLDTATRKLKLSRALLPLSEFQKAKPALESALHIFIDELREDRVKGTVEIIYSHSPMPQTYEVRSYESYHATEFIIGTTRAKIVRCDLTATPHLLVAGQTGGGKSTFLRHLIVSLYLSLKDALFTLIDLKGGLEFQLFENVKQVSVRGDIASAIGELKELDEVIIKRFALLKANKCKDIAEYQSKPKSERVGADGVPTDIALNRHIIVVDEAAELFLSNSLANPDDVRKAKEILSRVSRQGRSLGIHLIVATQRPDSRALDPQIKANLPGILSFQMANDTSSITVLGNGRATDLPPIPGRGIYKNSLEMVEVQTPYLLPQKADELLEPYRLEKPPAEKSIPPVENKAPAEPIADPNETPNFPKGDK
ncbi:MAG: hypothetical protein HY537_00410 [Deltaproteobacteria bacterium]|nr:hypothetical protein [Deltaproteobacteria bacterium]